MAKKKDRVPATLQPKQEEAMISVPVEIIFHIAASNVNKIQTPQGMLTTLSLLSPTGIAVTVKMSEENVDELIKDLRGSDIEIPKILLPGMND